MSEIPLHPNEWVDTKDEWTLEIDKAFPTRSGSHDEYATAMEMVHNRHSKGELVALVNWLLVRLKDDERRVRAAYYEGRADGLLGPR